MESWLLELKPGSTVALDGFQLMWVDRTTESGIRKGGGVIKFMNNRWSNFGQIPVYIPHSADGEASRV